MSKKEFYDFVNSCYEGNIKTQSLIPTDYCYNRYNFGWEGVWLLEYDENKKLFRLLGENYPYTGDVWHFPQGQSPYIYGHWSKGILKRYY